MGPFHTGQNGAIRDPMDGTPLNMGVHPGGLPVRAGDSPSLIDRSALNRAGSTVHAMSKVFEIPKDLTAYTETIDWITKLWSKGAASVRHEKISEDPTKPGTWHIFLCWVEMRGTIPNDNRMTRG